MSSSRNLYNAHRELMNLNYDHIQAVVYWLNNHLKENPNDENIIKLKDKFNEAFNQLSSASNDIEKIIYQEEED